MKIIRSISGQALTEYVLITGLAAVGVYVALMGVQPNRPTSMPPQSNVVASAGQNLIRTADGEYVNAAQANCDPELDNKIAAGVANLVVNRQSCVRQSLFSL